MSRLHSLEGREAEDVGLVVETHENDKSSMLYRVLPAIVQNRMPILPSLRRSVSEYRTRGIPSSTTSLSENLPETPPPLYTSRPVSSSNTPLRPLSVASTSVFDVEDDISVASSALTTVYETLTGISWQHAKHGIVGVTEAHRQASASCHGNDDVLATDIIRSQYLYGITVLLRSLPPTLTPAEQLSLRAAVPQDVLDMQSSTHALIPSVKAQDDAQESRPRTTLECATAWLVVRLFFFIQIMLPYIKQLLRHTAQFEHDHQITRRALNTSLTVGSDVSRRVTQVICRLNEGVAGEVISNATCYCAESIAGGIQQGLAEAARSKRMANNRAKGAIAR